ncbi:cellulose binding domain-containing protein [Streptomyces dysideae]|uniref:CBM2 domain-containing protein n=1 Tax=Streptomyces dysideae TaxID=909626 RepID=A0A101UUT1_9ACTN|nr:cellulose binding domain-containing protein [Streptomyces dysideae]KUO17258.1 hypothetical protein AQJ91_30760 [Streptomyces dysideae]
MPLAAERALDDWRVAWPFRDGQNVGEMWDARFAQNGSRVTATAYSRAVAANGTLSFGFPTSRQDANSPAYDFELNGRSCVKV